MSKIVTVFLVIVSSMTVLSASDKKMKVATLDTNKIKNIKQLTTEELQREVEKRIDAGTMCFEMGLELIKRWTVES